MSDPSTVREQSTSSASGFAMIFLGLGLLLLAPLMAARGGALGVLLAVPAVLAGLLCLIGLYVLQPNEAAILLLFGKYHGTDRSSGLRWRNPFLQKRKVSLRAHNLSSDKLKVNDKRGNPIEIAAAIVWRVQDTAKAIFNVEHYEDYVRIQSEAAIRHLANSYAYDENDDDGAPGKLAEPTLRASQDKVAIALIRELAVRLEPAGIEVGDARLTHLAYAPEIAQVMLRRQQAEAIISARAKIVEGAVSMVSHALQQLKNVEGVTLDDERRAAMVSNLLVVLCSDRDAQPIVNTGTLYP
jgi:regulator of protease activity HflC (stomatin/prohibitin superfamily)